MALSIFSRLRAPSLNVVLVILRWVQLIGAVLILALASYVADWYINRAKIGSPDEVNYAIFVPCWTILSFTWLMVTKAYVPMLHHDYIRLSIEATNVIANLVGFIVLAYYLSTLDGCGGNACAAARGAIFFTAGEWLLWCVTAFFVAREVFFGKRETVPRVGGRRVVESKELSPATSSSELSAV